MTTLVIAAHPDDEVLGVGGTMARLSADKHDVFVAILGEGITSRSTHREHADLPAVKALHGRSRVVAEMLGAKDLFMYSLPDNRFDTVPLLDVVKIIEALVDKLRPTTVYTQHGGDLNVDHAVTFRATLTATRPMHGAPVRHLYSYAVASSSEWAFQQFSPVFCPDTFVDVSATIERKIAAMQAYDSEARAFPHPRSPEALRAAATHWGSVVGLSAAEPFQCVRSIV